MNPKPYGVNDLRDLPAHLLPFADVEQFAQALVFRFELGESLQVGGRIELGVLELAVFLLQLLQPLQVGGRVIHQAARCLRDPLYRIDDQGDALAQ